MRDSRKLLPRVFAVVLITAFWRGRGETYEAQETHLDVTSSPSGAHVSVDGMGEIRKLTPLRVELPSWECIR